MIKDLLKVLQQTRTELVMTYLDYIELLSEQLMSQTNTSKTAHDVTIDEREREAMRHKLMKVVEKYSHYYCKFNKLSEGMENELTRRVLENVYPPVLPVVVQGPKRDLYPGKPDWLNNPIC